MGLTGIGFMDKPDSASGGSAGRNSPGSGKTQAPADAARRLIVATCGSLVLAGSVIAVVLGQMANPSWPAFGWAMGIMFIAAIGSLLPLVLTLRHGVEALMAGYFIAMSIRVLASLVLGVVAVRLGCPLLPLALEGLALYGVLLVAETVVLARLMWNARS